MTILSRLFVLVAVALLPAIAIQTYNEYDLRRAREIEVREQAVSLAKLAGAEQQQIVQGIRQVLIALSEIPSIKERNRDACNAYLAAMKPRFPAFLTLIITDSSGRSVCDTNADHKQVDVSRRPYFAEALKTGTFAVGEFSIGLSIPRHVIQFALPFYDDDGRVGGVIVAALGLDWLADYISQKGAPAGAALAIMDRNGTYLARYPDNGEFVGKKIPTEKFLTLDDGATADMRDLDGVERIVGFAPLGVDSGGLLVSFGLDKAQAFAEIQQRTWRGVLLIILSASLALVLTSFGARRFIHRPLGELVDAANRWRLGDFGQRVNIHETSEIGRVADAFNTMADALERREHELAVAKEKAEEAAARITMIFESTTDAVVIVDRDWCVTYLNKQAQEHVADRPGAVGMPLWEAFPDAADAKIVDVFRRTKTRRHATSFEALCPAHNAWYAFTAFSAGEDDFVIYFRDITEHKQALEARRLTEEQLHQSQKMEAVGQLTGGVAHDFNNLLTVIMANLELIEDRPADRHRVHRLAAAALDAADRASKLTAQLLAFSRRRKLNPKLVNAHHLVCEFQGLIRQAVGAVCEVKLRTDEPLRSCYVDPPMLQTAVLNLALNARDAMPDGGILVIETRNVILDDGSVPGCSPGSYVRLSVTDAGCGMTPEVRDRVFEPFFTTKELGKGTGLGLSMVYGFVRQSGGHVAIESALGVGTTVSLYLPQAAQMPETEVERTDPNTIPGGTERILIVEDNESLLQVTSEILMELGYKVVTTRNGAEAIQLFESGEEFDLMFSDIVMPFGMNGVELGREARRLSKGIKVLLTSGYADDVLERHGAAEEFPIIGKPFRPIDLAHRLRSILHDA